MDREPAKKFQDLMVWQKAHTLTLAVYKLTAKFPKEEMFGLTSQMRRSAASVPANIAEGFRRRGQADKARILNIAEGSLEELRYFFILAADLGYTTIATYEEQASEVGRMLGEVDVRKAKLVGERLRNLALRRQVHPDEHGPEPLARPLVLDKRRLQVRFGDDPRLAETLPDHRTHEYPPKIVTRPILRFGRWDGSR